MELIRHPDPLLSQPCKPMANGFTPAVRGRIRALVQFMYEKEGQGLAAVQVGWPVRLFVVNVDRETLSDEGERVFINPTAQFPDDQTAVEDEGCLSIPGVYLPVRRFENVTISAFTPTGMEVETFSGQAARIIQHELDHLDGVLILDRFSQQKKEGGDD